MPGGPSQFQRLQICPGMCQLRCWFAYALCFCSAVAVVLLLEVSVVGWPGHVFHEFLQSGKALAEFATFPQLSSCAGDSCKALNSEMPGGSVLLALASRRDRTDGGVIDDDYLGFSNRSASKVGLQSIEASKNFGKQADIVTQGHAALSRRTAQPMESSQNPWSRIGQTEGITPDSGADRLAPHNNVGSHSGIVPLGFGPNMDMHLPHTSLQELHGGEHGPLSRLLLKLRKEVSDAVGVGERRFGILGIKGKFKQAGMGETVSSQFQDDDLGAPASRSHQEVLLTFELLPDQAVDPKNNMTVYEVVSRLEAQLGDKSSKLLSGPLGSVLQGAKVNLSLSELEVHFSTRRSLARMSALVLPVGVSAAFMGILIWLCIS